MASSSPVSRPDLSRALRRLLERGRGEWWTRQRLALWPAFLCWSLTLLGLFAMTVIDARTFLIPIQIPYFTTFACWILWPIQALLPVHSLAEGLWPIPLLGWPATMAAFGGLGGVVSGSRCSSVDPAAASTTMTTIWRMGDPRGLPARASGMFVELLFLLPCLAGIAIGWLVGLQFEGEPHAVIAALVDRADPRRRRGVVGPPGPWPSGRRPWGPVTCI